MVKRDDVKRDQPEDRVRSTTEHMGGIYLVGVSLKPQSIPFLKVQAITAPIIESQFPALSHITSRGDMYLVKSIINHVATTHNITINVQIDQKTILGKLNLLSSNTIIGAAITSSIIHLIIYLLPFVRSTVTPGTSTVTPGTIRVFGEIRFRSIWPIRAWIITNKFYFFLPGYAIV